MNRRLIINADDYWLAPGVNRGILECVEAGAVTSVSALVFPHMPSIPEILKGRCGVHLHLPGMQEWVNQIDTFIDQSGQPTHLDSHHHLHRFQGLTEWYEDLCARYHVIGVPLDDHQRQWLRARGLKCADYVEITWTDGLRDTLERLLKVDFSWADSVHLMCHPGYVDNDLKRVSTMTHVREREMQVLMDPTFAIWLRSEGIELIGYADL